MLPRSNSSPCSAEFFEGTTRDGIALQRCSRGHVRRPLLSSLLSAAPPAAA